MNRQELIDAICEDTGIVRDTVKDTIASLLATVQEALILGERVQLFGIGTLEPYDRPPLRRKKIHEPGYVLVPKTRAVKFKPSGVLNRRLHEAFPPGPLIDLPDATEAELV